MYDWLLLPSMFSNLQEFFARGILADATQQAQVDRRTEAVTIGDASRIFSKAGNQAEITIYGVLTQEPDFLAMFLGGGNTAYSEILAALITAENDPEVEEITLRIDSPGGQIDGLFAVMDAIKATTKPVTAIVNSMAASAAYGIAAQADKILAADRSAHVGSIGVVRTFVVDDSRIAITSTEAPNKRPDPTTEEGKAVIRAELDDVHNIFVDAIAEGRKTTSDRVNAEFGKGALVIASKAQNLSMIDGIVGSVPILNNAASGGSNEQEAQHMDLNTLRAEHADVYNEAVQAGVNQERQRVKAHLVYGKSAGATDLAIKAIEDGTDCNDPVVQAEYFAARENKKIVDDTETDDKEVDKALANADKNKTAQTEEQKLEAEVGNFVVNALRGGK